MAEKESGNDGAKCIAHKAFAADQCRQRHQIMASFSGKQPTPPKIPQEPHNRSTRQAGKGEEKKTEKNNQQHIIRVY